MMWQTAESGGMVGFDVNAGAYAALLMGVEIFMIAEVVELGHGALRAPTAATIRVAPPLQWVAPNRVTPVDAQPSQRHVVLWSNAFVRWPRFAVSQDDSSLFSQRSPHTVVPNRAIHLRTPWLPQVDPNGPPVHTELHGEAVHVDALEEPVSPGDKPGPHLDLGTQHVTDVAHGKVATLTSVHHTFGCARRRSSPGISPRRTVSSPLPPRLGGTPWVKSFGGRTTVDPSSLLFKP